MSRKNTTVPPEQEEMEPPRPRIGELLLSDGLISQLQLDEALALQQREGKKIVESLIELKYIDPHDFVTFLSRQRGVASIELLNYSITQDVIDLVPAEFALQHEILPIDRLGRYLTVGMACPLDARTVVELEHMTGLKVRPLLVSITDIKKALQKYYGPKFTHTYELIQKAKSAEGSAVASSEHGSRKTAAEPEPPKPPQPSVTKEDDSVADLVKRVSVLPALPQTVAQVREVMEREDGSTSQVAGILANDPSLAAKVISLANSPAYGFRHRVDNVELATSLLGLREIFSVVLSSAVIDFFDASKRFNYREFWKRSQFAAIAAKSIAGALRLTNSNGIFAAGLLHDLGRLVFAEVAPDRYAAIDQRLPDDDLIAAEVNEFGVAHPELGYVLANAWRLPVELSEPIRYHHDVDRAQVVPDRVAIVALAALMTDAYGRINKQNLPLFVSECRLLLDKLGLSQNVFQEILHETARTAKAELN